MAHVAVSACVAHTVTLQWCYYSTTGAKNATVAVDLSSEALAARFERLVKAEMEKLRPRPKAEWQTHSARITSADLFKLDGLASGPAALAIIESREVTLEAVRRLNQETATARELSLIHI